MRITHRKAHEHDVLDISDRLTIKDDLESLEKSVKDLLARGSRKIALNLQAITYMDSTGSAMLIVCYNTAHREGVQLKFLNPSGHVSKILEITKLDSIFRILKEEELASES